MRMICSLERLLFESIRQMMKEAQKGLVFPMSAIMKVYSKLSGLSQITDRFSALMEFLNIFAHPIKK